MFDGWMVGVCEINVGDLPKATIKGKQSNTSLGETRGNGGAYK